MSATPTDLEPSGRPRPGGRPCPRRRSGQVRLAGLLCLLGLLGSCAEEPLPQRKLTQDDCLREVKLDRLKEAIERCDRVVAAYPKAPEPLNERFLLHSLAGDNASACRDIARAASLADQLPAARVDPLLRNDLTLRQASCRD
jgi:hypothetical protein